MKNKKKIAEKTKKEDRQGRTDSKNQKKKPLKQKGGISKLLTSGKKKKKTDEKLSTGLILTALIVVVIFLLQQLAIFSSNLIQLEALEDRQEVQLELSELEKHIIEMDNDFEDNLKTVKWNKAENRKQLAEKVRHLNYLNSHLLKTIEAYNQDFSLQFCRNNLVGLEQVFQEARNVQLISSRIANKIDTLLLFDIVNENQKDLLEKDLDLFYEKIELIRLFLK